MSGTIATIQAGLLYWGHVPPSSSDKPDSIRFRFERYLPLPVERVHVASAALPDGSTLVIGIEPERLRAHLAERGDVDPQTWELVPDGLPPHLTTLPGGELSTRRLNLLHGEFEPAPHRTLRRRTALVVQVALGLMAILMIVGFERRYHAADTYAAVQRQMVDEALAAVVPTDGAGVRPDLQLTMEVRRLEQAARDPATHSTDIAHLLQGLWRIWPHDLRAQVETLGVNAERMVIRGRVASLVDAERLASACSRLEIPPERFRAEPLQAQQDDRGATFLLTLVRVSP